MAGSSRLKWKSARRGDFLDAGEFRLWASAEAFRVSFDDHLIIKGKATSKSDARKKAAAALYLAVKGIEWKLAFELTVQGHRLEDIGNEDD